MKTFGFIFAFALFSSLLVANNLKLETFPAKSEVFILDVNGEEKLLGESPIERNIKELWNPSMGGAVNLLVKSRNYKSVHYAVPVKGSTDVSIKLKLEKSDEFKEKQKIDNMISELFAAQRLIRSGQLDRAISYLGGLKKKFPDFSVISEFMGNAYYLKNLPNQALGQYRSAVSSNFENKDAKKMLVMLERKLASIKEEELGN